MARIWRERIVRLRLTDTGSLLRSVQASVTPGQATNIELRFLMYGKYIADGVGRNFLRSKQGGGKIPFLLPGGEAYRAEHGLDKPKPIGPAWNRSKNSKGRASKREAGGRPMNYNPVKRNYKGRDFYYGTFYHSRRRLAQAMVDIYGQTYKGLYLSTLDNIFGKS